MSSTPRSQDLKTPQRRSRKKSNGKSSTQARAKRRGKATEKSVARQLQPGATVYPGQPGDVRYQDYIIEVKHRYDYNGVSQLGEWERQSLDNAKHHDEGTIPAMAFTGGKPRGGRIWIAVPIAEFRRLTQGDEGSAREALEEIKRILES